MKRMLFNATQAEELRVAIVDGQRLIDLDIESANKEQRKSNIYKAVITRIEPSLEAAFVDYGADRHGFLPFKEVSRAYFKADMEPGRARIQDALKVGQELIVQVEKDERGNKGAALTTFVSLAGRYLVLMPNNPRGGGVSRRVEGDERQELREIMDQLEVPGGMSLIARTAGIGRSLEELQWDLNYLLQLWRAIDGAAQEQSGAFLIYQESSLVIRAIRDYFHSEIGEILIDTDDIYEQAQQFMAHVMPGNVNRVKRYNDDVPLFSRFQIEHQIESAYSRQVNLPSGGAIVIDHTEALVSVDVNSGRATKGSDIEETAFRTNCEAADEIARQLRLRDLGGLIVIDFIDMESSKNQREVENRLRDALHHDRARVQTGKISRFGLLELSRQRLRPALAETSYITCPRCTGTGHIRSTESAALHILRIIEEEAMKENTGAIHIQVPVDVATFLLNEKRSDIARIELRHRVNLLIVPNRHLETPQHEIVRLRHDQLNLDDVVLASYQMVEKPSEDGYRSSSAQAEAKPAPKQEAVVKGITPEHPAPVVEPRSSAPRAAESKPQQGLFAKIVSWLTGGSTEPPPAVEKKPEKPARRDRGDRGERGERGERNGRDRSGRSRRDGRDGKETREERQPRESGDRKERSKREEPQTEGSREPRRQRGECGEKAERNETGDRQEKQERTERGERSERREERQPRQPRAEQPPKAEVQVTTPAVEGAPATPAGSEESEPRRRGRRGGRGRGERRNEESAAATPQDMEIKAEEVAAPLVDLAQPPVKATQPAPVPAAEPAVATEVMTTVPEAETTPAITPAPATAIAAMEEVTPPPAITPAPVDAQPPVTAQVVEQASPAAVVTAVAPVLESPAPIKQETKLTDLDQAGLVMIETTVPHTASQAVVPANQPLGRKPKPVPVIVEEPLQIVETRH